MIKPILQGRPIGHPLHPLLVHFPIALFILALLLDLASFFRDDGTALVKSAFASLCAGLLAALFAAVAGFADYADIRADHHAKKTATYHMLLNIAAVLLYAISVALRWGGLDAAHTPILPFLVSLVAAAILAVSGYLGGHIVYNDGVAVGRHRRTTELPPSTITVDSSGSPDGFAPVAQSDALKEAHTLRAEVDGVILAVARVNGACHAVQEFCTHRFGPLSEGALDGNCVICPWHQSKFDLETGKVADGPATLDLKSFPVVEREGQIWTRTRPGQPSQPDPAPQSADPAPDAPAPPHPA